MRTLIKHVLARTEPTDSLEVAGWVRTRRDPKGLMNARKLLLPWSSVLVRCWAWARCGGNEDLSQGDGVF